MTDFEHQNWVHVKSEWQKNPEISTLCATVRYFLGNDYPFILKVALQYLTVTCV